MTCLSKRSYLLLPAMVVLTAAGPSQSSDPTAVPVPHRAIYAIDLAEAEKSAGVSSADGRMVFEITGNACDGYTVSQRMVLKLGNVETGDRVFDFRTSSFESGDGELYQFASRTIVDDRTVEEFRGTAERNGDAIDIHLESPNESSVELGSDVLFPGQHLAALLKAAQSDERFLSAEVYEGSGSADSADTATAIIGGPKISATDDDMTSGNTHWPVSIAYFSKEEPKDQSKQLGEEMPSYQLSFKLHENGVARDLILDYGDYSLTGTLQSLEALDVESCE